MRKTKVVPLRYRLSNPPPAFTGRVREQEWLRGAIGRGSAVLVCGLAGIGKTSLARKTLHTHFAEDAERTVMLSLTASEDRLQLLRRLLEAMSSWHGIERIDWKRLRADVDTAIELVLDLAEQNAAWVVIDDLHHAPNALIKALLGAVAAYARKSRWLALSRVDPNLDAPEVQCTWLEGMPQADLLAAGRLLWPNRPEASLRRAAADAGGSPWRMRQILKGDAPEGNSLPGLPAQTEAFVTLLHALVDPLPLGALKRLGRLPGPDQLLELECMGIIERTSEGYRLHDAARSLTGAAVKVDSALHRRIAESLSHARDPRLELAALRHHGAAGDVESAAALLRAGSEARLLSAGYGRELWSILEPRRERSLALSRLRCAVELGDADILAAVTLPERASIEEQLLWARRLHLLGHAAGALEAAHAVHEAARAAGDSAAAFGAGMVRVAVLVQSGRAAEALEHLRALAPVTASDQALIDASRVRCLVDLGLHDEALALCEDLRARLSDLDVVTRIVIGHEVGIPTVASGNIKLANSIFDLVPHDHADETLSTHHSRLSLVTRTGAALMAGRLAEAQEMLEKLGPFQVRGAPLQLFVDMLECSRRIFTGDLDGLDEQLRAVAGRAWDGGNAVIYTATRCLEVVLATLLARPAPGDDDGRPAPGLETPMGLVHALLRQRLDLRLSADGSVPAAPSRELPTEPEGALIAEQVFAIDHLVRGELHQAVARGERAVAAARRRGHTHYEAVAMLLWCDCLLAAGQFDRAHDAAQAAVAHIVPFGSERLSASARFAVTLARPGLPDPVALERFAALGRIAPDVARRAQALLGAPLGLDAVERCVHRAVVTRHDGRIRTLRAHDGAWRAGWGLDRRSRLVWLPSGRVVSLARSPQLWRTLEVVVQRRHVTKEELVREAWSTREYHPERHDNRLFAMVNKLRQLIEDSPRAPSRIITLDGAYCLGGDEPVRVLD
ncbi:hypothetical protein [Sorangium sp. So ce1389]|uniref:hypothetical protein n=1 Tax=Sorangium sp. So ce1389 TaxID=3133336 RepID=UPI003F6463A3